MKNAYRIVGDSVAIEIKYRKTERFTTFVDLADLPRLLATRCTIYVRIKPNTNYAILSYCRKVNDWTHLPLHRWLLNASAGTVPDHHDGNGLNNRRSTNLQIANNFENGFNKKTSIRSTSGVRGVYPAQRGLWRVRIQHHGVRKSFGGFKTVEAATVKVREVLREGGSARLPLANRVMELASASQAVSA